MVKTSKKFISIILSLVLILSLGVTALAVKDETPPPPPTPTPVKVHTPSGDTDQIDYIIVVANYEGATSAPFTSTHLTSGNGNLWTGVFDGNIADTSRNFVGTVTIFWKTGGSSELPFHESAVGGGGNATLNITIASVTAPTFNVTYTDGTNSFNGGSRIVGASYTVLTFAQTGLPTPAHKHFTGWTTASTVSTNPGDAVAQPAGNVLYTAQFADDPTFHVTYEFTGSLPSPVPSLPSDGNSYYSGDLVYVARGYDSIYDTDNQGTWIFNGWDKGDFNITADTTIHGSWRFVEDNSYVVTYVFYGASPSSVSPPIDGNTYQSNELVVIADGFSSFYDATLLGTWSFNGWAPDKNFNIIANTTITGTWTFTPDPPQPTYANLTIEKSVSGFKGETTPTFDILVEFTQPLTGVEYDKNYVTDNGDGSFTFKLKGGESATLFGIPTGAVYSATENRSMQQHWSYDSGEVTEKTLSTDVTETIYNIYSNDPTPNPTPTSTATPTSTNTPPPATYPVTYNYVASADSGTLPAEISTLTGAYAVSDSNTYLAGATVNRLSTAPALGTVYTVPDGVWTLTAWSESPVTMAAPGVTFTGTWTFGAVAGIKDEDGDVLAENEKLPQTGGISASTLIGLMGLALIALGGTTIVIFKKRNDGTSH